MLVLHGSPARIEWNPQLVSYYFFYLLTLADKVFGTHEVSEHIGLIATIRIAFVVVGDLRIVKFVGVQVIAVEAISPGMS